MKKVPCVVLTVEVVNGNNFPDLVLDVLPGNCNWEEVVVVFLLADIVLRDLRRLVSSGADGAFHLIGCKQ